MTSFSAGISAAQVDASVRVFAQRFSSTPLGARLARHLALQRLDDWGVSYGSELSDAVALVVGELVANAVTHGRVAGRDFELAVCLAPRTLAVAVSDARGERLPPGPGELRAPGAGAGGGRGLLLVDAVADRWEVVPRVPVGKTVRAEIDLPPLC